MNNVKTILCKQVLVLPLFLLIYIICKNVNANNLEKKFHFDIQYKNFKTGQIFVSYEIKNKKLILTSKSVSEGFLSFFYSYQSQSISESIQYNNEWLPSSHVVRGLVNDEKRISKVKWIDGKNILKHENFSCDNWFWYRKNRPLSPRTPNPTTPIPITEPPRKATLRAVFKPVLAA